MATEFLFFRWQTTYSLGWILLFLLLSIGAAALLYRGTTSFSKPVRLLLFSLRTLLLFVLLCLLLEPVLRMMYPKKIKPTLVFLVDDSQSVGHYFKNKKPVWWNDLNASVEKLNDAGYTTSVVNLKNEPVENLTWKNSQTDLSAAIRKIHQAEEANHLVGIVLISDGIFNTGVSPLYTQTNVPLSVYAVGDTIAHPDLRIQSLQYNKLAYQGNQFIIQADILSQDISSPSDILLQHNGKELQRKSFTPDRQGWAQVSFTLPAQEMGVQSYEVKIIPNKKESNVKNNQAIAILEIIKGKKRFLLAAPAPSPDIRALKEAIEQNAQHQADVYIRGTKPYIESKEPTELVIVFDAFSQDAAWWSETQKWIKGNNAVFFLLSDHPRVNDLYATLKIKFGNAYASDVVTPVLQPLSIQLPETASNLIAEYPPVFAPFGTFDFPQPAQVYLTQQIGNVKTERPWLWSWSESNRRIGMALSGGLWRWRLAEYAANESTEVFDDLLGKFMQQLSSADDKSKFRCFPAKPEFAEGEAVQLNVQLYNDVFELIEGEEVDVLISSGKEKPKKIACITQANTPCNVGTWKEGVYKFQAVRVKNKNETVSGHFIVRNQAREQQNLQADFSLLRQVAKQTHGHVLKNWKDDVNQFLPVPPAKLQSQEEVRSWVDVPFLFFIFLLFISIEWFIRKYKGSY